MKVRKRFSAMVLAACMVLSSVPAAAASQADTANEVERINVQGQRSAVYTVIGKEFAAKNNEVEVVYNEAGKAGDILVVTDGEEAVYGKEGYGIAADDGMVTVTAAKAAGAAYGLRDVLKQLESTKQVESKAAVTPSEDVRALFVDCGRKYFSVEWFEKIIREMAWNGMNTLYMSFSNDEGFRLLLDDMSISYEDENGGEITLDHEYMAHIADNPAFITDSAFLQECNEGAANVAQKVLRYDSSEYLTQQDMENILTYARVYGVNVIPELNSPGHLGQVLWYFPEYRNVGIWGISTNPCYALNLESQEAKNFASALVQKYVDFFSEQGCTDFCVGGDEFAAHGSSNETIAAYVNSLADYVESKGMTAYAWVDGQSVTSGLLKKSVVVNDWNSSGSTTSNYRVVNFNSSYMYYVLKASGDWWLVKPKEVFEIWNPLKFQNGTVSAGSAAAQNVLGACMAVWCDDANAKAADVILRDMMTDIKAFGYRVWNYNPETEGTVTYEEFIAGAADAAEVGEAEVLEAVANVSKAEKLEVQLAEAEEKADLAAKAAEEAQKKLSDAQSYAETLAKKAAAAADAKAKLTIEVELYEQRAKVNKLAVDAAAKKAEEAQLKAAAATLESEILALDGNAMAAADKKAEADKLTEEVQKQNAVKAEKERNQAALDKAAADKKTELVNYKPVTTVTVKKVNYKILNKAKKTAAVTGANNKKLTSVSIAKTVKIGGVTYKVTQINAKAFKNFKRLRKVTIGSNIKKIEKEAFANCGKLQNVNMKKAGSITSIKSKAFSKIHAKAKITVPSKKFKKYAGKLRHAGLPKTAKIKK